MSNYRKDSDSTIFKNFTLQSLLKRNKLNILEACLIPNTNMIANEAFIDDEAFIFSEHILHSYGKRNLKKKKKNLYLIIDYLFPIGTLNVLLEYCQINEEFFIDH